MSSWKDNFLPDQENRMNGSKRLLIALVLALLMGGAISSAALAHECTNPNINDNAIVGTLYVPEDFDFANATFVPAKNNPYSADFMHIHGAWIKIVLPFGFGEYNVFVKSLLPDGALDSGPGEDGCDGKGIDDLDACLAMVGP
jgi:hypothetical protein